MYRTLDSDKIISTLETLEQRISERFAGAGLARVAGELTGIAREANARCRALARPSYGLRLLSAIAILCGLAGLGLVARYVANLQVNVELFGLMQGIEATSNLLVLVGAAVLFLVTLEKRTKRSTALRHLHELRSIVHVVDMHQLTKDPSIMLGQGAPTAASQQRPMTPFELTRYLDYCSELLSLSAKIAALYAQSSTDPEVIEVVNDIERLTTNLSSKIWQKITLVEATVARMGITSPVRPGGPLQPTSAPAAPTPPPSPAPAP
jgi:hypothetical protein